MSVTVLYSLAGIALVVLGLYALFASAQLMRKILAINVMGSGVFLILIALADRGAPATPDPVPQALVLTGIVVAVSATALALNVLRRTARCGEED